MKEVLKDIIKNIFYFIIGILIIYIIGFLFFLLDRPGECASSGGAWDYEKKECIGDKFSSGFYDQEVN